MKEDALRRHFNYKHPDSEIGVMGSDFKMKLIPVSTWVADWDTDIEQFIDDVYKLIKYERLEILRLTKRSNGQDTLIVTKINRIEDYE